MDVARLQLLSRLLAPSMPSHRAVEAGAQGDKGRRAPFCLTRSPEIRTGTLAAGGVSTRGGSHHADGAGNARAALRSTLSFKSARRCFPFMSSRARVSHRQAHRALMEGASKGTTSLHRRKREACSGAGESVPGCELPRPRTADR